MATTLRQALSAHSLNAGVAGPFIRAQDTASLLTAVRKQRLGFLRAALHEADLARQGASGTPFDESMAKALALLVETESAGGLLLMTRSVTWEVLAGVFEELDVEKVMRALRRRLDRRSVVVSILEGLFGPPESFAEERIADLATRMAGHLDGWTLDGRRGFVDRLLARRDEILSCVFIAAGRGMEAHQRELRVVTDQLGRREPHRAAEVAALGWEVFYLERIASQLERGEAALVLATLPDMVDPELDVTRRTALFEMARRLEPVVDALELVVNTIGSARQQGDMRLLRTLMRAFIDNFTPDPPTLTLLQEIANAFGAAVDSIGELRNRVQDSVSDLAGGLNVSNLLGTADDDAAVNVIGTLFGAERLAVLPTVMKSTMVNSMADGGTGSDDELGILRVFETSRNRPDAAQQREGKAELLQLVLAGRFERLDFSFDGDEHERFMGLLESL